jgi:peptide chain release factor 2
VAVVDVSEELKSLSSTMESIEAVLDLDRMRADIAVLEEQAAAPDLWDDVETAQQVNSKLSYLQGQLRKIEDLRSRIDDLGVLFELAEDEDDADTRAEADRELADLHRSIDELEVRTLLSGEYDPREAVVSVRAEAGGVDAADFAEQLMRMYLRWAERKGYPTEVYDISYAEEAGVKSATFAVKAPYAYGTLSVEQGTHRMVRISPFDNQGRRQTSFSGVEVLPVVETTDHIDIPENELRIDVFRSSGPGGQSVNTTDSAVRMTHLPTGIVVSCQNEKSQIQNRAAAMRVMQSRLLAHKRAEEQAKMDALKGDGGNSWGNQMRSYVLHPYQMVKDLRTEHEVGNPQSVLDGDLDGFIDAGIRWRKQQEQADSEGLPSAPPGETGAPPHGGARRSVGTSAGLRSITIAGPPRAASGLVQWCGAGPARAAGKPGRMPADVRRRAAAAWLTISRRVGTPGAVLTRHAQASSPSRLPLGPPEGGCTFVRDNSPSHATSQNGPYGHGRRRRGAALAPRGERAHRHRVRRQRPAGRLRPGCPALRRAGERAARRFVPAVPLGRPRRRPERRRRLRPDAPHRRDARRAPLRDGRTLRGR